MQRGHGGLLWTRNIKTPEMDNPTADGLIGYQSHLEELSDVFRSFWTEAKILTVRVLVRFPVRDQNASFSLCC
jgi:hypothetical protein